MKIHRLGFMAAFAATLSACGDSETMMSDYGTAMDRHVEALRGEMSTHSQEIATAQDADAMARAEAAHWQRNDEHMGKMDLVMGDMMSCTDRSGNRFDHGRFSEMMHDTRTECDRHRDAMRDAADLDAGRLEEMRHQNAMKAHFDRMHDQVGTMMGMAGGFSCGHCNHCGM